MEFEKLLDNCATLENTISILVKNNAVRQLELTRLQSEIYDSTQEYLEESAVKERAYQLELDDLKVKRYEIETDIKQFSEINKKLSELVAITQMTDSPNNQADMCKNNEMYYEVVDTINDYEQIKLEYIKLVQKIDQLNHSPEEEVKELIRESQELLIQIHKNDCIIRLSDQQNKYAEQQFDLILNQLPWEPLTGGYINELRNSPEQTIRDLAEVLQIQAGEIEDLNDSIRAKKQKKLEVLEALSIELNTFLRRREEAVLMANLYD